MYKSKNLKHFFSWAFNDKSVGYLKKGSKVLRTQIAKHCHVEDEWIHAKCTNNKLSPRVCIEIGKLYVHSYMYSFILVIPRSSLYLKMSL